MTEMAKAADQNRYRALIEHIFFQPGYGDYAEGKTILSLPGGSALRWPTLMKCYCGLIPKALTIIHARVR
jgi:hypothetical protein